MNLSAVINQLITLFFTIAIGYVAASAKMITPEFRQKLSALTLNVACPGIILSSALQSTLAAGDMLTVLITAALFFAAMIVLAAAAVHLLRTPKQQRGLDQLMLIFTNVGFMGIPVVSSVYGADGVAMVSMFILMFNLAFYSYGLMLVSGGARFELKSLKNPCIFAALGAMFFALTGWRLPAPIESALSSLGATTTPLSMLIIGASLCHSDLRSALTNPRLYKICLLSMLAMPLCILALVRFMPIDPMLMGVSVLMAAMPIGSNCAMVSDLYTPDDPTASHAVLLSTIFSGVSLPLVCALMAALL